MVDTQITVYTHRRRSTMARQRRNYTREFKVEAVKLVTQKGYSVAEAARSLGIGGTLLRSWEGPLEEGPGPGLPRPGNPPALEQGLRLRQGRDQRPVVGRGRLTKR